MTVLNLVILYTFLSYAVVYYSGIHLKGNYCVHLKRKYQVKFMGQVYEGTVWRKESNEELCS